MLHLALIGRSPETAYFIMRPFPSISLSRVVSVSSTSNVETDNVLKTFHKCNLEYTTRQQNLPIVKYITLFFNVSYTILDLQQMWPSYMCMYDVVWN